MNILPKLLILEKYQANILKLQVIGILDLFKEKWTLSIACHLRNRGLLNFKLKECSLLVRIFESKKK